jgi:hypothetical protein
VTGKRTWWLLSMLLCAPFAHGQSNSPATPAGSTVAAAISPEIFAPGVISGPANDGSPTFSPDGKTLFFTRSTAAWGVILESHQSHGKWSEPQVAPFSGEYSDSSPGMAPDGSFMLCVSLRPKDSSPADSSQKPQRVADLWRSDRTGSGWSKPVRMPDAVNIGPYLEAEHRLRRRNILRLHRRDRRQAAVFRGIQERNLSAGPAAFLQRRQHCRRGPGNCSGRFLPGLLQLRTTQGRSQGSSLYCSAKRFRLGAGHSDSL